MEAKEDNATSPKKQKSGHDESCTLDQKGPAEQQHPEDCGSEGGEKEEGSGDAKPEIDYDDNQYRKVSDLVTTAADLRCESPLICVLTSFRLPFYFALTCGLFCSQGNRNQKPRKRK